MPLRIVHYNDPVLRKKGVKVTAFNQALQKLAGEMVDAMHAAHGIGLAAQQIGQAIQLCVVDLRETQADFDWELDGRRPPLELFMPMVLTNPVIAAVPEPEFAAEEGCLSFPGINGDVSRPDEIEVKYQDEHGTPHVLRCNGLFARCILHEADHLNGVLFIDRMDDATKERIAPILKELRKKAREAAKK
ncbi:MAG: peptide deformylase [Opitutus sp.]|nr:peptide deformylase [Opitutus sp.]